EPGFADIDSHARFALGLLFGHILALHAGLAPHHLFRTRAEERMDQALPRGSIPRVPRSHPLASGTAAAVPDAQPLCSESAKSAWIEQHYRPMLRMRAPPSRRGCGRGGDAGSACAVGQARAANSGRIEAGMNRVRQA